MYLVSCAMQSHPLFVTVPVLVAVLVTPFFFKSAIAARLGNPRSVLDALFGIALAPTYIVVVLLAWGAVALAERGVAMWTKPPVFSSLLAIFLPCYAFCALLLFPFQFRALRIRSAARRFAAQRHLGYVESGSTWRMGERPGALLPLSSKVQLGPNRFAATTTLYREWTPSRGTGGYHLRVIGVAQLPPTADRGLAVRKLDDPEQGVLPGTALRVRGVEFVVPPEHARWWQETLDEASAQGADLAAVAGITVGEGMAFVSMDRVLTSPSEYQKLDRLLVELETVSARSAP